MYADKYKSEMAAVKPSPDLITNTKNALRAELNNARQSKIAKIRISLVPALVLLLILAVSTTILAFSKGWISIKKVPVDGQTNEIFNNLHLCFDINCSDEDLAAFNLLRVEILAEPENHTSEIRYLEDGTANLIIVYNTQMSDTVYLEDGSAHMIIYHGIPLRGLSERFGGAVKDSSTHNLQCENLSLMYSVLSESHTFDTSNGECLNVVVTISSVCRVCGWPFDVSGHGFAPCEVIHK